MYLMINYDGLLNVRKKLMEKNKNQEKYFQRIWGMYNLFFFWRKASKSCDFIIIWIYSLDYIKLGKKSIINFSNMTHYMFYLVTLKKRYTFIYVGRIIILKKFIIFSKLNYSIKLKPMSGHYKLIQNTSLVA